VWLILQHVAYSYICVIFLDINECAHPDRYPCYGICKNLPGGFNCLCPSGTDGNPHIKEGCIAIKSPASGDMLICIISNIHVGYCYVADHSQLARGQAEQAASRGQSRPSATPLVWDDNFCENGPRAHNDD